MPCVTQAVAVWVKGEPFTQAIAIGLTALFFILTTVHVERGQGAVAFTFTTPHCMPRMRRTERGEEEGERERKRCFSEEVPSPYETVLDSLLFPVQMKAQDFC